MAAPYYGLVEIVDASFTIEHLDELDDVDDYYDDYVDYKKSKTTRRIYNSS